MEDHLQTEIDKAQKYAYPELKGMQLGHAMSLITYRLMKRIVQLEEKIETLEKRIK